MGCWPGRGGNSQGSGRDMSGDYGISQHNFFSAYLLWIEGMLELFTREDTLPLGDMLDVSYQ